MQQPTGTVNKPRKVVVVGNAGVGKTSLVRTYVDRDFKVDHKSTLPAEFVLASQPIGPASTLGPSAAMAGPQQDAVTLQIWDTAGQERYRSLAPTFYKGSDAVVAVYDVSDSRTLDAARRWVSDALDACAAAKRRPLVFIVGNKNDLIPPRPPVTAQPKAAPSSASLTEAMGQSSKLPGTHTASVRGSESRDSSVSMDHTASLVLTARAEAFAAESNFGNLGTVCAKTGVGVDDMFRAIATEIAAAHEAEPSEVAPPSVSLAPRSMEDGQAALTSSRRCRC